MGTSPPPQPPPPGNTGTTPGTIPVAGGLKDTDLVAVWLDVATAKTLAGILTEALDKGTQPNV
jgi:hypothetical protein